VDRVPVLKIGDILLVSIQIDMEDQVALQLQEDLADRIVVTGCHGVIIDMHAAGPLAQGLVGSPQQQQQLHMQVA